MFLIIIVLTISFYLLDNRNSDSQDVRQVKIGNTVLDVKLAKTGEEQARGLSGLDSLGRNEGMLFVFESSQKQSFWMKDMNFPIDIIWIDENKIVVYIKENAKPESYPETFISVEDSKYVLEVFAGFSKENNLKQGDRVEFVY